MSRCFPYPPPGYYRNGATNDALIESIKLQKETVETKAQRKHEKKAKKEKKEKRQKHKETNHDLVNCKEAQIKKTRAITEVLEKSDLTEEYGQPISQQQPSYSSDSTQNSNKRKRDDYSLIPDSSTGNGSFKIRLLKKQKGLDSRNLVADVRSNNYPLDRGLVSCTIKNAVSATSVMDNRTQLKSNPLFEGATIGDTNRLHFARVHTASSFAKPILECNRPQQQVLRFHSAHELPTTSVSRNVEQGGRQHQPTPGHQVMSNFVSNNTITSASRGKTIVDNTSAPANDDLTKQKDDLPKVRPTRSEKKMLKKHAKYEKLIGSWLQPVIQAHLPTDDDWLCSSKTSNSSTFNKGEVETCREMVASWQPCARFLAEVDVHALPYTVPF